MLSIVSVAIIFLKFVGFGMASGATAVVSGTLLWTKFIVDYSFSRGI